MRSWIYWTLLSMPILFLSRNVPAQNPPLPSAPTTLLVTILDENGSLLHNAHIYIFSRNRKEFFGTREAYGTTTFDLPAGDYRIYAGMALDINGVIDHYASPEASVSLSAEEPTSIILSLQKAPDDDMALSDSARQKLDVDPALANYLN